MTESTGARGRLAQMIATRGGQAPPEAPFVIEHREALIYMLCEAAELEHGIMCQYLYAAFSLKQSPDEGLTATETQTVQRWRQRISDVAAQEMLHLALVQNLLSAIGGAPHLSPPCCPWARPRCGTSCSWGGPRAWTSTTPKGWPPSAGPPRPWRPATSSPGARISRPSGTCTGRSRPASRTWPASSASSGCSSAR